MGKIIGRLFPIGPSRTFSAIATPRAFPTSEKLRFATICFSVFEGMWLFGKIQIEGSKSVQESMGIIF